MRINKKSIYANPYKYAVICDVPIELARTICKYQRYVAKVRYNVRKCPICGRRKLHEDSTDYDFEGNYSWIECDSCGKSFDYDEIINSKHLSYFSYWDEILYLANVRDEEEWLGIPKDDLKQWHDWCWKSIRSSYCNK